MKQPKCNECGQKVNRTHGLKDFGNWYHTACLQIKRGGKI